MRGAETSMGSPSERFRRWFFGLAGPLLCAGLCCCTPSFSDRSVAGEPNAFPLDEYPLWDRGEPYADFLAAYGYGRLFVERVGMDVTDWWVVLVEPGEYLTPVITVVTDAGSFRGDTVVFATNEEIQTPVDPPVTVNVEDFERYALDGEVRVVAFVHFPNPPKGRFVRCEVSP